MGGEEGEVDSLVLDYDMVVRCSAAARHVPYGMGRHADGHYTIMGAIILGDILFLFFLCTVSYL